MPSLTDLERAWEGYSYVIVSTDGAGAEARSWRLEDGRFREETLHAE
jgi:proteasome lid subunit RPN8/RPN11